MKKILFIANKGYSKIIIEKLEQLGYEVDYFNDKPNDGFMSKSLGRFRVSFYEKVLTKYYLDILDKTSKKIYDYVFMIRGEYITEDALRAYNDYFSSAKKILYMWDSVANCKGIEKKWKFFDEVYTFDRKDYHKYKEDYLKFLPLFYADQYRNQKITSHNEYDIAFIGTAHGDRPMIMKRIQEDCRKHNKKMYVFLYSPHPLVFLYNKMFNKYYKNIKMSDVTFKLLPTKETVNIYSKSKCIIDVESSTQTGLTMRTIEVLGLRKKLITTNKDIVNYDFYNENNYFILDRESLFLDYSFIDKEYIPIDKELYEKYSLENWLNIIIGGR